ncbi:MAG: PEGA domain-containing protein [bacterium]
MTKKLRFIILLIFVFIFALATPLVILRAQGYQFDLEEKKLINTGGIFLKSTPGKASIYLNNKILKVQTPAIISRLIPGKYFVSLELDGFYSWQKKLVIEPNMIVKQDSILLLPKEPKLIQINKLPEITVQKENKLNYNNHEIWLESGEDEKEIKLITRYAEPIKQAFLYKDHEHVVFLVGDQVKFIELYGTNIVDFIKADKIFYQDNKLFVEISNNWFVLDEL